ncbi:MAG: c-type cytochrome, partial [Planctomycetes bacterium]|nr:c-type cytochrome [Planctomycetota bacterium]
EAAPFLFPPARRFDTGRFRLVSSQNGAPFDRDLVATLRRGVPGSAMPGWGWLAEEDLWALADYVRFLAVEGLREDLAEGARRANDPLLLAESERIARARLTPNRALKVSLTTPTGEAALAHGKSVFLQHCAQCHAADGTGEPEPRLDEDETLNWARDFTAGFLKGGDSPRELAYRIRAGMPGTAMPPTELAPGDEADLIAYVRSLVPEGTAERLVHRRETLEARRVERAPLRPDEAAWAAAEEISVVLAPLWWNPEAVHEAQLAALHDESNLALRLSWEDESGILRLFSEATPIDAAALQLSDAPQPPLFGMGSPHAPTNLWHWQALRLEDVAGALDLIELVPHALRPNRPETARADVPLYLRLLGRLEPSDQVDRITVAGVESIARAERVPSEVHANARWQEGRWSVVFHRPLHAGGEGQIALIPGHSLQVACAVWNGAAGDGGARKSISIWQELVLAR